MGFIKNPKRAIKNKIYRKTTFNWYDTNAWLHFLLLFTTCGIGNIVYIICKNNKKKKGFSTIIQEKEDGMNAKRNNDNTEFEYEVNQTNKEFDNVTDVGKRKSKKSKPGKMLLIFAIITALLAISSMSGNMVSAIIAIIQTALFVVLFLTKTNKLQLLNEKTARIATIIAFVLFIPFAATYTTTEGYNDNDVEISNPSDDYTDNGDNSTDNVGGSGDNNTDNGDNNTDNAGGSGDNNIDNSDNNTDNVGGSGDTDNGDNNTDDAGGSGDNSTDNVGGSGDNNTDSGDNNTDNAGGSGDNNTDNGDNSTDNVGGSGDNNTDNGDNNTDNAGGSGDNNPPQASAKKQYKIKFNAEITKNDSVGDQWTYEVVCNSDKTIQQTETIITISGNEALVLVLSATEYDKNNSDVGSVQVTLPDIQVGEVSVFTQDVIIRENDGRYKGNTATCTFTITYEIVSVE